MNSDIGMPLIDYCKDKYKYDPDTCDSFNCIIVFRPYRYRSKKTNRMIDKYIDINVSDVVKHPEHWKDYVIIKTKYGADCATYAFAELPCKTVSDLIKYFSDNIAKDCIFQEALSDKTFKLDYVKTHIDEFKQLIYIKDVDINKDNQINYVYFMKNDRYMYI